MTAWDFIWTTLVVFDIYCLGKAIETKAGSRTYVWNGSALAFSCFMLSLNLKGY